MTPLTAQAARTWQMLGSGLVFFALAAWAVHHALTLFTNLDGNFVLIYTFSFLLLFWQFFLYSIERPTKLTPRQQNLVDELKVAVIVPAYNEDPELLSRALSSFLTQTRLPQQVWVIDDGSDKVDYEDLPILAAWDFEQAGIEFHWETKENGGKRTAQAVAFQKTPDVDIYITVDSDSVIDPCGFERILRPFARNDTHSVAGMVLCINNTENLLSRFTDLWWVTMQMVTRSSLSTLGSVMVNSGAFAAYRATKVRENLHSYLNETFCGRPVPFSDDSLLTLYCLVDGRAVQEPQAYAFTAMPTKVSHHLRQFTRWMRGSFIRSLWRFRYLPVNRYAYWAHLANWAMTVLGAMVVILLFVVIPFKTTQWDWTLLLVPISIGFGQATRYMMISRSDQGTWSQFLTFLTAPVAFLWSFTVLRVVRWYAVATCFKLEWGTRQDGVEVGIEASTTPKPSLSSSHPVSYIRDTSLDDLLETSHG